MIAFWHGGRVQHPSVRLVALDTVWFQVGGTVCNLACKHCLVSASPTNHTHERMGLAEVRSHLEEAVRLGAREYYFTGGEPFLNPEMEAILGETLAVGPATVLTNGLLLDPARCARLRRLADTSEYSLDLRVSVDGYDAAGNDAIRGPGTFARILDGVRNLDRAGLLPVVTVTAACPGATGEAGRQRWLELLAGLGIAKPRLKVLPLFHIGAEHERSGGRVSGERLSADDARGADAWDHLQCSSCRMVTDLGVWVCPILVNEPAGRMGDRLADTLVAFPLAHAACVTCHVEGVTCRT
jgi:uncharacterized Fe-S cluster-containing radical SAM superfamily protein